MVYCAKNALGVTLIVFILASMPFTPIQAAQGEYPELGKTIRSVHLTRRERDATEWADRVSKLAYVFAMGQLCPNSVAERLKDDGIGKWVAFQEDNPRILVKILPDYDEVRIIDLTLADRIDGDDIGEKAAVIRATGVLRQLHEQKLLDGRQYDLERYQVGYHLLGEGSLDGRIKRQHTAEYRVTFLAQVDGIPLANAGVRVAVHRSGQLSGLRFGGVSVSDKKGETASVAVSKADVHKHFKASIPDGLHSKVAWEKVMYVMPEGMREAAVMPAYTISYSLVGEGVDGSEVVSRRKTVGISLADQKASLVDYLPPAREHESGKLSRDAKEDESIQRKVLDADPHPH